MVEAVGFRVTSDVVSIICMVFAMLYFTLAGGPTAFRQTCKRQRSPERDLSVVVSKQHEDNYFKMKSVDNDETVSHQSRISRSSSFIMIGPTSPGLTRMRLSSIV